MKNEREDRRKIREKELNKMTVEQLGNVRPYKAGVVVPIKKPTKAEMVKTILQKEGL